MKTESTILITGGAGFIGQRLSHALIKHGSKVRILDNFSQQVHESNALPDDLTNAVELIHADVRDESAMKKALVGVNKIVHLAAETGTGQSMYEIDRYFSVNVQGTATLLHLLQNDSCGKNLESITVASSRAIYGEGAYTCNTHGIVYPSQRTRAAMQSGNFDPFCPHCDAKLGLTVTQEETPFNPMSYYGLTKQVQEQAVLMFARTRGINGFGLRYQNVYGPGQSLKNPYTGILAVFSNLARQNQSIEIYEDGLESRDFVYIDDVVDATLRCVDYGGQFVGALNVGSGVATSVSTVAEKIKAHFDSKSSLNVTGAFRVGDIRHNIADTTKIQRLLGFSTSVSFSEGLHNFLKWASEQPFEDTSAYLRSVSELSTKGLMGQRITQ
jgi:dTDP-L-rhamnose 4-epimerase